MKYLNLIALILISNLLNIACAVEPRKTVPKEYQAGQKHFHRVCANCHGPDAMGGNKAPKLIQKKFAPENYSNDNFTKTILNGSSSGIMRPMRGNVSDKEIREIIKYIRYLQNTYKSTD